MNLDIYTDEMKKSIWDKAFFVDKIIGAKCIIDFGCADGAMIRMLAEMFPQLTFYGYDINEALIDRAQAATKTPNVQFFAPTSIEISPNGRIFHASGFTDMICLARQNFRPEEICLNFSSVLHEVFSSHPDGQQTIKRLVKELQPKYITIRDMYFDYDRRYVKVAYIDELINKLGIERAYMDGFEEKHGTVLIWEHLIHFLMKYQWKDNGWDEEMEEDYFSWRLPDLLNIIGKYDVMFEAHYMLPYYSEKWKDFLNNPNIHTHAQFVLRREEEGYEGCPAY